MRENDWSSTTVTNYVGPWLVDGPRSIRPRCNSLGPSFFFFRFNQSYIQNGEGGRAEETTLSAPPSGV